MNSYQTNEILHNQFLASVMISRGQKMQGIVFDFDEPYCDVSDVILTRNKFFCRYAQQGYTYRVEATSRDGIIYRGYWGYPDYDDKCTVEFTRFESKTNETVLLGAWRNAIDHYEGVYLVRLKP